MELQRAVQWNPPPDWRRLTVIDSHTGGEPFRVVVDGLPDIPGDTVLERRRYAMEHLDYLRQSLMWEPRGHADMYGAWLGPPFSPTADMSVLFLHNDGFSTMCGHGIIALAKVVLDTGILPSDTPETTLRIDTPAGLVQSVSTVSAGGLVIATRFRNVPSFVADLDALVEVGGYGSVTYDLAFGGAFYALVEAAGVGLSLGDGPALIEAGRAIKRAISQGRPISHPEADDLGFLYGVIFTGPPTHPANHSRNVCIFADGEVDRSPTGTGVSARLAVMFARKEVNVGEEVAIESIVGSTFTGRTVEVVSTEPVTIIPEVSGSAHITGRSEFWIDPSDKLGRGFLIKS
ncbi:MAG TPA: proline racemase family protein [Acidimicrobiia bacterium]|jgi:trans-L-3-hydroxyproline dehydratase|nr:proline racemase family protein [Acidimicrobiia bacterium]